MLRRVVQVQHQVPIDSVEQILEPELILDRRMVNRERRAVTVVLVKWGHLLVEEGSIDEG